MRAQRTTTRRRSPPKQRLNAVIRQLIANHEAGHAAISLVLEQGHQLGVTIVPSEDAIGSHAVGDQYGLARMPAAVAVREAIKRAMVGLGGPITEREFVGDPIVLDKFLRESGPDAEAFKEYVDGRLLAWFIEN